MRIALSEANVFQVQLNNILIKCEIGLTNSHRINQKLREVSFLFNNLENSCFSQSICSEYRAELWKILISLHQFVQNIEQNFTLVWRAKAGGEKNVRSKSKQNSSLEERYYF